MFDSRKEALNLLSIGITIKNIDDELYFREIPPQELRYFRINTAPVFEENRLSYYTDAQLKSIKEEILLNELNQEYPFEVLV